MDNGIGLTRDDAYELAKQGARGRVGDYVIQETRKESGNVPTGGTRGLMVRAHVPNNTSNNTAQSAQRAKMRAAVDAWQAASGQEREAARIRGKRRGLSGWNQFLSEQLKGE